MAKTYYEENKEKRHDYYEENRERRLAYGRKRYQEKKSDCQAASKKYRKKHAKKAACDHEAECPDNPYKKKIAELTEALKAASPPPSREAREAAAVVLRIEISRILGIVLGDLTYWHEKAEWLNEFADWLESGLE